MLDFIASVKGLEVSFRSLGVPSGEIPAWDFGVSGGSSSEINPTFQYETSGFYTVTLTVHEQTVSKTIIVSEYSRTHLTDSIYALFDNYIPESLKSHLDPANKAMYINKWQLYMQPLVNHEVPLEEYNNELYYEGLENQLILECSVFDYLYTGILNLLATTSTQLQSSMDGTSEEVSGRDRIKQITTGPTEVQYYDTIVETVSSLYKAYITACSPGGILDTLKQNLCMLSKRLDIYLPICTRPFKAVVPPRVAMERVERGLDGPNPDAPLGGKGRSLIPNGREMVENIDPPLKI